MDMDAPKPNEELKTARELERKWFSRTLIASLVALVAFMTGVGLGWWGSRQVAEANRLLAAPSPEVQASLDQIHHKMGTLFIAYSASLVVLLIAGLLFLIFLVRWLLAIRARRKVEVQ